MGKMTFEELVRATIDRDVVVEDSFIEPIASQTDLYDEWLNAQFEKHGLYYCITCQKFTDSMDCIREGHELAQSVEEMVEKQVMTRLKGG